MVISRRMKAPFFFRWVLFRAGQAKPARWWLLRALGLWLNRFYSLDYCSPLCIAAALLFNSVFLLNQSSRQFFFFSLLERWGLPWKKKSWSYFEEVVQLFELKRIVSTPNSYQFAPLKTSMTKMRPSVWDDGSKNFAKSSLNRHCNISHDVQLNKPRSP